MRSTGRFTSERYPGRDASDGNAYEDETRHSEHRRRSHRRYEENYDHYGTEARYEHSWRARHSEYCDTRDGTNYHQTQDRTHEGSWRRDDGYWHNEERYDRGSRCLDSHYSQDFRKETKTHLKGPSLPDIPQRSHSESPPPQPIPSAPSHEYFTIASETSQPVSSPPRKLLILDLNGTLLVRVRSVGAIYPRPYMSSFRDYLFCPAARKWLDVMIWSSAQPHNVERMVRRCFFHPELGPMPSEPDAENDERKSEVEASEDNKWHGKLIAAWARDTLGLSRSDYSRKAQTTKDLDKPWSSIPGNHDARTTILLDDSPRKARLQPFNHVCIGEYLIEDRNNDKSLKKRLRRHEKETEKHGDVNHSDDTKLGDSPDSKKDHEQGEEGLTEREKARKRKKEEKRKRREEALAALEEKENTLPNEKDDFDSALLAIIGILDTLKYESNVAGWIRAGGLWAGKTSPHPDDALKGYVSPEKGGRPPSPTDLEVNDDQGGEDGEKRPVSPSIAKRQRSLGFEQPGSAGGDSKRTKFRANGVTPEPEEAIAAGNDAETIGTTANPHEQPTQREDEANKGHTSHEEQKQAKMWFEDQETFRTWVERGRTALRQLGIAERDGVHLD